MSPRDPLSISRAELFQALKSDNLVRQFEKVLAQVADNTDASTAAVAATGALQDATAITLSPNDALNNERVLAVVSPLAIHDNGPNNTVVLGLTVPLSFPALHALIINLIADTNITLPPSGRLLASNITSATYANDAAAAAAGLAVGEAYRQPAGVVTWRQV